MTYSAQSDTTDYIYYPDAQSDASTAPSTDEKTEKQRYVPQWISIGVCVAMLLIGYAGVYFHNDLAPNPRLSSYITGSPQAEPSAMPPANNTPSNPTSTQNTPDTPPPSAPNALSHTKDPDIQEALDEFTSEYGDTLHMYAANLNTDRYADHQPKVSVPSGSIYKLFIAGEVFRRHTRGELELDRPSGVNEWTIGQCTQQMVQNSSNACGEALRAELGPKTLNRSLHEQGYTNTDVAKDPAAKTSARDVALILQRVYDGGYFTKAHTRKLDSYLKQQLYTFRIPEGLPREPAVRGMLGTRNKTGDVYGYTNDAAIVLGENTDYLLVVLSGQWSRPVASSYVHRYISGTMYNFFNDTDYSLPYEKPERLR